MNVRVRVRGGRWRAAIRRSCVVGLGHLLDVMLIVDERELRGVSEAKANSTSRGSENIATRCFGAPLTNLMPTLSIPRLSVV